MPSRAYLLKILLFAMLSVAVILPSTAAAHSRTVTLHVGKHRVTWRTPERLRAVKSLSLSVGRRSLDYEGHGCVGYASGAGLLVRLDGCGRGAQHVRLRIASVRDRAAVLRFHYTW